MMLSEYDRPPVAGGRRTAASKQRLLHKLQNHQDPRKKHAHLQNVRQRLTTDY